MKEGFHMQLRHLLAVTTLLLCAGLMPVGSARAATVLYDSAGFIRGSQSFVDSFNITTPGTLTISLSDVPWLDTIAGLNFFLTSASGVFGPSMSGGGTESIQVGPGTMYAHWVGNANGSYGVGVFALKMTFQPGVPTAVPLPGALVLLLSGLGLLFASRWRRAAAFAVALAWAWYVPADGARDSAASA
jgi:hypothetical protein